MSDVNVKYKCTSVNCRHVGQGALYRLPDDGCALCGCKRLEVWHPTRGHLTIDWRAQKSVRKHKPGRRSGPRYGSAI